MADGAQYHETKDTESGAPVETTDRGLFDFAGKKKDEDAAIASEFSEKVQVSEEKEKKEEKLHRSSSSSSSSSDEEQVEEGGEKKKKKKKSLKDKLKEEDTSIPIQKSDDVPATVETGEKKGFLDKIKEKLPGGKKTEEAASPPPPPPTAEENATNPETTEGEKKGFLEKIKDKLPGFHSTTKTDVEKKEKEKEEI
ncbi:phosphoprotein ECPP44-like [Andrographis paniculata]|uniref:phosphoprotein ECPP44-like n=1 Tax=Andrographis paniculata TaxID=175694 RepID=UPI0021E801AD|nr:phosphoprotein ECPP44-like [Andrographis paniculata]